MVQSNRSAHLKEKMKYVVESVKREVKRGGGRKREKYSARERETEVGREREGGRKESGMERKREGVDETL